MKRTLWTIGAGVACLALATAAHAQPANDLCSGATQVFDGDNAVTNVNATTDTTNACITEGFGGAIYSNNDTWYYYIAPETGVRNFETTTRAYGFAISVYDDCGGSVLGCDFATGIGGVSKIYHLPVTAGTRYGIHLAGAYFTSGSTTLRISPPPASAPFDDCDMAMPISGQGAFAFSTVGLTNSDRKSWDCDPFRHDCWFAWTPSQTGVAMMEACDAGGTNNANSLQMALYGVCGEAPLLCNSNFQDPPLPFCQIKICHLVVAGQTYYIRLGVTFEQNNATGNLNIEVRPPNAGIMAPAGAIDEPGDCEAAPADDINGGCDVDPPAFTPMNLCEVRTGTCSSRKLPLFDGSAPAALTVDSDWYEFTLDTDQAVTVTGESEFPPNGRIMLNCPAIQVKRVYLSPSCTGTYSLNMTTNVLVAGTYYYVISPQQSAGTSASTCGNGDRYWFRIEGSTPCPAPCAADFNGVNGVTVQDIFDFLTAWLAGNPSADFNHINGVTVQDIFDFLTAWLAGC